MIESSSSDDDDDYDNQVNKPNSFSIFDPRKPPVQHGGANSMQEERITPVHASYNTSAARKNSVQQPGGAKGSTNQPVTPSRSSSSATRPVSPSPSTTLNNTAGSGDKSDRNVDRTDNALKSGAAQQQAANDEEAEEQNERERKSKIQIYVFALRCIAYPFNAKQPTDMTRRLPKVTKQQLAQLRERFQAFLNGETSIVADEAFKNAVQCYYEVFLKGDRIQAMTRSGACSMHDVREVFRINIEKRVRSLPEIDGLNKETVITSWMTKFDQITRGDDLADATLAPTEKHGRTPKRSQMVAVQLQSEMIMTKEQLYDALQSILGVKKYEHQILYNALQLDNADEQASQVRRELDGRAKQVDALAKTRKYPKFVVKEMESMYIDELRQSITLLMANLESVPVSKEAKSAPGRKKYTRKPPSGGANAHAPRGDDDAEVSLSRVDIQLNFQIEIVVVEVKGLKSVPPNKIVFCTMEVDGCPKLQTDQAEAAKPLWDTQGDFQTKHPIANVKVRLCMENSKLLSLDHTVLGKFETKATCTFPKHAEWYKMDSTKQCPDDLRVKLIVRMEKPNNLKYCGWCWAQGQHSWKRWKLRYFCLVQVSQYTFAMCEYREKKNQPVELAQLDGFTVDYAEKDQYAQLAQEGGKFFFNLVKEGDFLVFATDDENERSLWIQAIYRATGQSHKPTPPTASSSSSQAASSKNQPLSRVQGDDKARKHGLDEYVQADPCQFPHQTLFRVLQSCTLDYRLGDPFASLGWFNPGQMFVLDEYCARYGVRGCMRHLCYLNDLLTKAESGTFVDPTLIHYSFAFCASHVHGNRPDGIGTVLGEEREMFEEVKERLRALLVKQIEEFRTAFPFGRPEGALKATLSLLERVLMKDIMTPAASDEVRNVIKKCLERAALVNYTAVTELAKIDARDMQKRDTKRVEDLIHVAELCIEILQQNDEHYAEEFKSAFAWFSDLLVEHEETFWSLFTVDMDAVLSTLSEDNWDAFPLFQIVNDYLRQHPALKNGKFHAHLRDTFAPMVVRYVDLMEGSIGQSIAKGFEKEKWEVHGNMNCCATSEDMLWKLEALQKFVSDLHWPDAEFASHLENRLKMMAADMIDAAAKRTFQAFDLAVKRGSRGADYEMATDCLVMVNVILVFKQRIYKLCAFERGQNMYHSKTDELLEKMLNQMSQMIISRLTSVMESVLQKLTRYDEGTIMSSFLSIAKPVDEIGKSYVDFMQVNMEQVRNLIVDDPFALQVFEQWYGGQMKMIQEWLTQRASQALHPIQVQCLVTIYKKCYSDFELQGVTQDVLESKVYQSIQKRLQVEETTMLVKQSSTSTMGSASGAAASASNAVSQITSKLSNSLNINPGSGLNLLNKVTGNGFFSFGKQ